MSNKKYLFYISQNYSFAILRPIQEAILDRGDEVAWFLEGDEVNAKFLKKNETQLDSIAAIQAFQPDAVFVPGNVVPNFIPGLKVGVFHGFNSGKKNRRGFEDHFNIRGCFDLYCTQGPNTTNTFKQLAAKHKHFSVVETGWPAIDPLYDNPKINKSNNPTILMCSTFSRNLTCAPHLFDTIKKMSTTGKWNWLIQFHPKMDKAIVEQYKSIQNEYLTFVETDNVIPLLQQADVMVCDTSSVLIMFLLLNKPVVTFNNIDPKSYLIDINDPKKLAASIELALSKPSELMSKIDSFIKKTHPYQDGMSSQRVLAAVDDMLAGSNLPSADKPVNFIRNLKMRKQLNYWKF
ncbi:CDP-glycerol glycerophosphotransferase family protein [Colwelliaceae bacterium 6471]